MNDKIAYIETENKKYPIVFNLNVMEEIQEKYGSMSQWGEIVENTEGGEPKIKDLKIGLMEMMNEAIDIENEGKEVKEPFVNAKQVGRIIGSVGFDKITKVIKDLTIASTKSEDNEGKNE
jgi:hypothetical protein